MNRKRFSQQEEDALIEALKHYGTTNPIQWAHIKADPRYKEIFAERTNVDLKDKYKIIKKNASKAALL